MNTRDNMMLCTLLLPLALLLGGCVKAAPVASSGSAGAAWPGSSLSGANTPGEDQTAVARIVNVNSTRASDARLPEFASFIALTHYRFGSVLESGEFSAVWPACQRAYKPPNRLLKLNCIVGTLSLR